MEPSAQLIDGKYQLVEVAGEGGMATVYKAVARGAAGFQRTVAIKHIKPEFRALKNYIDMFIEEARVGSELAHPNIVQVHDFVSAGRLVLPGHGVGRGHRPRRASSSVVSRRAARDVPWPLAVAIGIGTLRGLGAAHDRLAPDGTPAPVIHRDVSPHNVLLGINGVVKLSDFGLARARDRVASLTAPGTVKGKLSYLAPEVTFGKPNTRAVGSVRRRQRAVGDADRRAAVRRQERRRDLQEDPRVQDPADRASAAPTCRAALAAVLDVALAADPNESLRHRRPSSRTR